MVDAVNRALRLWRNQPKGQKYVGPGTPKNQRLADTEENHIKFERGKWCGELLAKALGVRTILGVQCLIPQMCCRNEV